MQIKCDFYSYEFSNWEQYEVDLNLNIYPCCHYYTDFIEHGELNESLRHIDNNLKTNKIENIFKEYDKVLNEKTWKNKKTCPPLCMKICQIK